MIPANHQIAGFGDFGFGSHSNSVSRFNFDANPNSDPNPKLSKLQFTNQDEEDEWGDFVSSPNNYGTIDQAISSEVSTRKIDNGGGLKVGPTQKEREDGIDEWSTFVSSSVGFGTGTSNRNESTEILGKKLENGGLKVGSTHKQQQDWSFFFSSSVSSQLSDNGTNFTSPIKTAIPSEISNQKAENGVLHVGPTESDGWASFTGHQISDRNLANGGLQLSAYQKPKQLDEEEDEWDTFISSPVASRADDTSTNGTKTTIFHEYSHRTFENVKLQVGPNQKRDGCFEEEEWGDFVSSPVASGTKNDTSSNGVKWEKPKGPLPLSFFGGEEDEPVEDEIKIEFLQNPQSQPIVSISAFDSQGLNEMIVNLCAGSEFEDASSSKIIGNGLDQEATITTPSNDSKQEILQELSFEQGPAIAIPQKNEGGFEKNVNEKNGVDEEIWDFKDALLDQKKSTQTQEINMDDWASFASSNEKPIVSSSEMKPVLETDQSGTGTSESTKKNFVLEFYRKLREGSLFLISRHLKGLKEASKVAAFSGQADEEKKINEKIQKTYRQLEKLKLCQDLNIEDYSSKELCINDLLNSIENPHLKAFEQEYHLSTKLYLALEELSPAIHLLKHSLITINALEIALIVDINAYISTWFRIISVCAQELQSGAIIWTESPKENMSDKLISIGENYFTALGEIYRVIEIIELTLKYFNSWLLISNQKISSEIGTLLEICTKSWSAGLDIALERISNSNSKISVTAKSLAKSIKRIFEINFDEIFFGNHDLCRGKMFCKICLLPLAAFQDMKAVSWSEDKYLVKIANLWANKISSDPPNLPTIRLG